MDQRAEYLADAQAARAAGTAAVIALHERFLLESQFELTVQQAAQADDDAALFARLHEALEAVPERERERRAAWRGSTPTAARSTPAEA